MTSSARPSLAPETVVARSSAAQGMEVVGGDLVLLDPQRGVYFGLDAVGGRIWELIAQPRLVAEVCSALQREFNVTAERCQGDVLKFLEQLAHLELVEIR